MGATLLILAKSEAEQRRLLDEALKTAGETPLFFTAASFAACLEEMETLPLVTSEKHVVLQQVDQLDAKASAELVASLKRPNSRLFLYLVAASLPATHKLVKAVDRVMQIKEEKAWEKEERLARWAVAEAAAAGRTLSFETALAFVKRVDSSSLQPELEKLIAFVGEAKQITAEAVSAIVTPSPTATLWQLGDAIFARNTPLALRTAHVLFNEGMQVIPLLSHVRSQLGTAYTMLQLFHQKGTAAVAAAYPYLKGKWLEKKLAAMQHYGIARLERGMVALFDTEIKAKSSTLDATLLVELLLVRITDDTLSAS